MTIVQEFSIMQLFLLYNNNIIILHILLDIYNYSALLYFIILYNGKGNITH